MFTLSRRLRLITAVGAAGAALATSAVASAATPVHPGTGSPVVVAPPKAVALDPGKVGSAGQPGWTTAKCEQMAAGLNKAANDLQTAVNQGDLTGAQLNATLVDSYSELIGDHCLVVD